MRIKAIALLTIVALMFVGCPAEDWQMAAQKDGADTTIYLGEFDQYELTFVERTYDPETDKTTFKYKVYVAGHPDLRSFFLTLPDCELPDFLFEPDCPCVEFDEETGIIHWNLWVSQCNYRTYKLIFDGYVPLGIVDVGVKNCNYDIYTGYLPGPSCGTLAICGTVFLDVNCNNELDINDQGIPNVRVELYSTLSGGFTFITDTLTDENGEYCFTGLGAGPYAVYLRDENTEDTDFNESLFTYFWLSSIYQQLDVTLDVTDSLGHDFAFKPDMPPAIGTGKTIGFWRHQLKVALTGSGRAQIDAGTMEDLLRDVQELALPEPFQFPFEDDGEFEKAAFEEALAVLSRTSPDAKAMLLQQLLATELNHVKGLGLPDLDAQLLLIYWGEYLAYNSNDFSRSQLLWAKDIFDTINNTGN